MTSPPNLSPETLDALAMAAKVGGHGSAEEYLRNHLGLTSDPEHSKTRFKLDVPFKTRNGRILHVDSLKFMRSYVADKSVDLIFTSPPFCLLKKKEYGNEDDDSYLTWFSDFAHEFKRILKPNGSLVLDLGGSWYKGAPSRSLYHFDLLTMLCRRFGFHLAQEFYWWNPSKLPTPAEWVTIRKVRVKDAVNTIWWLSPTPFPKANNQRIRWPYGEAQRRLIDTGKYNAGVRPSGHVIKEGTFNADRGGSIPPNLIALPNTDSGSRYDTYCAEHKIPKHPARFPVKIPEMFIQFLTDPGDVVLDPFGGSCATGEAAERLRRRWTCCELELKYIEGAIGRFSSANCTARRVPVEPRHYAAAAPNQVPAEEDLNPLPLDGGASRSHK